MPLDTMLQLNKITSRSARIFIALALFSTSSLVAQSENIINVNLQLLAWDEDLKAVVKQANGKAIPLVASQKRISTVAELKTTNPLTLYHAGKVGGKPMVTVPLKPGVRDILLIIRERKGRYNAIPLPYSQRDFPMNTVTFFNLTSFPVMAQIDGQRQMIKKGTRHQVPYEYEYAKKESLRTKFAVEHDGRMRLVQNSHVPLTNQGRVLFFISETESDSQSRSRYPVSFTYAYDSMLEPRQGPTAAEIERQEEEEMLNE